MLHQHHHLPLLAHHYHLLAPSPDFDGSPSSLAAPFDSSPSSLSAPSANLDGSQSSSIGLLPNFHASRSSATTSLQSSEDSLSLPPKEPAVNMTCGWPELFFGTAYYCRHLQNKGILFAAQQLMAGEETGIWMRAYASEFSLFHGDSALAMMKLSNQSLDRNNGSDPSQLFKGCMNRERCFRMNSLHPTSCRFQYFNDCKFQLLQMPSDRSV